MTKQFIGCFWDIRSVLKEDTNADVNNKPDNKQDWGQCHFRKSTHIPL